VADLDVQLRSASQTDFAGVFAVNAGVVTAFTASASQWRTVLVATPAGLRTRFLGLDYAGVKVALEALQIRLTPDLWAGLASMEQAAAAALNGE
jgi:hypothetical protein